MLKQDDSQYEMYSRIISRVFRTTSECTGLDGNSGYVRIPAGSPVEVVDANRYAEPTYTKKRTDNGHTHRVDDGVRLTIVLLTERGNRSRHDISYDGATRSLLVPEPGIPCWPQEFSRQANMQGWDIFFCDGSDGPLWQLQAVYEEGRFENEDGAPDDTLAWEFVWDKAVDDEDPICLAALAYLRHRSPKEYEGIREHCLKEADSDD